MIGKVVRRLRQSIYGGQTVYTRKGFRRQNPKHGFIAKSLTQRNRDKAERRRLRGKA